MTVLPYGDRALLVQLGGTEAVLGYLDALRAVPPAGVLDLVPAAETVLVVAEPATDLRALRAELLAVSVSPDGRAAGRAAPDDVVEIPVVYDGEDLAEVATLTGLSERDVVAAHTGQTWRVAFGGFAPGFAYLVGEDERLAVPRRTSARTVVPAGAVGLAGSYSGIYPRPSPGGWQLIGTTHAPVWDLDRDPPALLRPGGRVRFVEVAP